MRSTWWPTAPKGISLPAPSLGQDNQQYCASNLLQSFLNKLLDQPDINNLINDNYIKYQTTLIHHDLDQIELQENLVHQLLTANPLTITTHNPRKLSDITKYAQLLETLTLHKVDICRVIETGHSIGQKYKLKQHPKYSAFWSTPVNRYAGVGLLIHRK